MRRLVAFGCLLLLTAVMSGCGTQLSRSTIRAAAGNATPSEVAAGTAAGDATENGTSGGQVGAGTADAAGSAAGPAAASGSGGGRSGVSGAATPAAGKAAAAGGRPANLSPVKVGSVGTYSGVLGAIFRDAQPMIQAWAQSANSRGGLNGHPVQVLTADDGGDPARNLSIVKNMVENQGVIAFVSNIVPLSVTGSLDYLQQKGIPVAGGDIATTTWWESPVLFPQGGFIDTGLWGAADASVKAGQKSLGLLFCGEATACTHVRDIYTKNNIQKYGGNLVYTAQISLAQPDFTAECLQARNAGVQALIVAADGNTLTRVARSCHQQNYRPQLVSFGLALVNSLAEQPDLDGMIGVSTTAPWWLDVPQMAEYNDAIHRFASNLNRSGATIDAWLAGKLLEAGTKSLSATPTSREILNGLAALKNETLGGTTPALTFSAGGNATPAPCFYSLALRGGHFVAASGLQQTCISRP